LQFPCNFTLHGIGNIQTIHKEKEMDSQREGNVAAKILSFPYGIRQEWKAENPDERDVHPVVTLDELGMILDCNKPFERLFGFEWHDLLWHHISRLFPQLSATDLALAGEVYPILDYLIRCGQPHQAQSRHGVPFTCHLIFARIAQEGRCCLELAVFPHDDTQS
jgi:PAS domain-containing protein